MKRRMLHILNWDKYQARTDKELPWLKLWGRLFKTPWFQLLPDEEKFVTIALLDLARQFHNNIPEEVVFKGYLRGNYGVFISQERVFKLCKVLVLNNFLSDNCPTNVEVEGDKTRQDKRESDKPLSEQTEKFEKFYSKYPKKQDKAGALKAFLKLAPNDELLSEILMGVEKWSNTEAWKKDGGQFIPMPSTFLNRRRWEDEVKVAPEQVKAKAFPTNEYFG